MKGVKWIIEQGKIQPRAHGDFLVDESAYNIVEILSMTAEVLRKVAGDVDDLRARQIKLERGPTLEEMTINKQVAAVSDEEEAR